MIDFATLQSLTIPEGEVTQIADAAGNVLWSAQPQEKLVYLRPSADISLGHPVYPETLTAGYLAICEEVSDSSTTYIGWGSATERSNATSVFLLSASSTFKYSRIVSARLGYAGSVGVNNGSDTNSTCTCTVFASGTQVFSGKYVKSYSTVSGSQSTDDALTDADMPDLVAAINNYIRGNGGNFPEIKIEVSHSIAGSSKGISGYLTQLYIELTCE